MNLSRRLLKQQHHVPAIKTSVSHAREITGAKAMGEVHRSGNEEEIFTALKRKLVDDAIGGRHVLGSHVARSPQKFQVLLPESKKELGQMICVICMARGAVLRPTQRQSRASVALPAAWSTVHCGTSIGG